MSFCRVVAEWPWTVIIQVLKVRKWSLIMGLLQKRVSFLFVKAMKEEGVFQGG
jgi:hypothetical protein